MNTSKIGLFRGMTKIVFKFYDVGDNIKKIKFGYVVDRILLN